MIHRPVGRPHYHRSVMPDAPEPVDREELVSAPRLARSAGVTLRILHHWVTTGRLTPTVPARGSGSRLMFGVEARGRAFELAARREVAEEVRP